VISAFRILVESAVKLLAVATCGVCPSSHRRRRLSPSSTRPSLRSRIAFIFSRVKGQGNSAAAQKTLISEFARSATRVDRLNTHAGFLSLEAGGVQFKISPRKRFLGVLFGTAPGSIPYFFHSGDPHEVRSKAASSLLRDPFSCNEDVAVRCIPATRTSGEPKRQRRTAISTARKGAE
jgi:hypothetical protein